MNTILLIEDNIKILDTNREFLQSQGYNIQVADTLAAGELILRKKKIDLLILDIMLPDGSGIEFCAKIRKFTDIPVLYLTCLEEGDSLVAALDAGGDEYVTKPYSLETLSARVKALLRRYRVNKLTPETFTLGPLFVDCGRRIMLLGNVDMNLRPKEYDLLLLLVRKFGQRFTAEELYSIVWAGRAIDARTVVVHISSLRKKLDDSPFYIATEKRKYYSLQME